MIYSNNCYIMLLPIVLNHVNACMYGLIVELSQYLDNLSVKEPTKPHSVSSTRCIAISRKLSILIVFLLQTVQLYVMF